MRCKRIHRARRYATCVAAMVALCATDTRATAQQPYPPPNYPGYPQPSYPQPQYPYPQQPVAPVPGQGTPALPTYRTPLIIVAAPTENTTLPEDKPVAVLRFMSVEPLDPIDALSFSVSVDGKDKTALFRLTQGEAWGPLADPNEVLASGQHEITARICSARGSCGTTKATVTVVARSGLEAATSSAAKTKEKKTKVLDAAVQAARILIR